MPAPILASPPAPPARSAAGRCLERHLDTLLALILVTLLAACDGGAPGDPAMPPTSGTEVGSAPGVARSERFELRRDAVRPGRADATARSDRFLLIRE